MSLTTTVARIQSILEAVSGVENVRARPGIPLDLEEATATWLTTGEDLQRWTIYYATVGRLAGANANHHVELRVRIVAEWSYRESADSYLEFAGVVESVYAALMDPSSGFPQIADPGIDAVETPGEPVRIETGEAAYRLQFQFDLLNVTDT